MELQADPSTSRIENIASESGERGAAPQVVGSDDETQSRNMFPTSIADHGTVILSVLIQIRCRRTRSSKTGEYLGGLSGFSARVRCSKDELKLSFWTRSILLVNECHYF